KIFVFVKECERSAIVQPNHSQSVCYAAGAVSRLNYYKILKKFNCFVIAVFRICAILFIVKRI
ncbi:MAG: hypothetical protein LUD77_01585, partial [Clostridiales bacterium]|nr:hypothetical protein [Clostridiales bacterium]